MKLSPKFLFHNEILDRSQGDPKQMTAMADALLAEGPQGFSTQSLAWQLDSGLPSVDEHKELCYQLKQDAQDLAMMESDTFGTSTQKPDW